MQIAEHASQDPAAGEIDVVRSHAGNDIVGHRVHDITDQRNGCHDGCRLVDEGFVVASNAHTGFDTRLLIDTVVVVPLGKGQEKRHQEGHQHKPVGYPDICRDTAGEHTHHETDSNYRHVENGNLFQSDAIGDVHQPVSRHYHI